MQYRLKAMTEKTVVCGQDFPERDSYAARILRSPKMNFASRAVCEKQNVVAALKQTKVAGNKPCNLSGTTDIFSASRVMRRFYFLYGGLTMDNKIAAIKEQFLAELAKAENSADLEAIRVAYLGKKGYVTELMKEMKDLSVEEKKTFGQKVNVIKGEVTDKIAEKNQELKEKELLKEIESMPEFDISMPPTLGEGSYHPVTLVQRQCENIFKSMGFAVEDYSEIVSDYECFEALNIPKHHPARDMQDTYYLDNGQLLKSHTSAAQNAIYKKYKDALVNDGVPIKAIFPGRCFRNEATDACHENTFFQMEGVMVDKDISISNLIYFMKTMLSEVFQKDLKVRLRPGFFPFVEPGFELDISCLICGGEGCPSCKHSGWLELCPCGMIHPEVLKAGGIDPDEYTGFAFGLGLTRLVMMKYGIKDIRDLNGGSLKTLTQFTDDQ